MKLHPRLSFTREEIIAANEEWGCNCGPAALAACTESTLDEVHKQIQNFDGRRYMSPTMMGDGLRSLGWEITADKRGQSGQNNIGWPDHGLVRIQWEGPWTAPGSNPRWAYGHTHWVSTLMHNHLMWFFDINAGWQQFPAWRLIVPETITSQIKRATGEWYPSHIWSVRKIA